MQILLSKAAFSYLSFEEIKFDVIIHDNMYDNDNCYVNSAKES